MLSAVSFQMTDACNLACSYCYFAHKVPVWLSDDTIDRAADFLVENADPSRGRFGVNFFGGEPFMAVDGIRKVMSVMEARFAAKDPSVRLAYSTTTNGTLFDDAALELCLEKQVVVQLSLDGVREAHDRHRKYKNGRGSFDRIVANLPRLKRAPNFAVRMTLSPETIDDLPEGIQFLLDEGVDRVSVSPVCEVPWSEDDFQRFADAWRKVSAYYMLARLEGRRPQIRDIAFEQGPVEAEACRPVSEYGCGAAVSFVFVDIYGDLYPCHRYPGYFDRDEKVRIGTVQDGFLTERRNWFIEANRGASKKGCSSFLQRASGPTKGACSDCVVSSACGGACIAMNHAITGDPAQPPSIPGRLKQITMEVRRQALLQFESLARPTVETSLAH